MRPSLLNLGSALTALLAPCVALLSACGEPPELGPSGPGLFCAPGESLVVPCGYNDRGGQLRVCSAEGGWREGGECEDPDVCEDGDEQVAACLDGAFGAREQVCAEGAWVSGECRAHAISTSVTAEHTCAVRRNGRVICWGKNDALQLGNATDSPPFHEATPLFVNGAAEARSVAVGARHSCALHRDGTVSCWGWSAHGRLGHGGEVVRAEPSPIPIEDLTEVSAIALGDAHSCAIREDGGALCWGSNSMGQLGIAGADDRAYSPRAVDGLSDLVAIAPGFDHTCALDAAMQVYCWGSNAYGQLGIGESAEGEEIERLPVAVPGLDDAIAISSGSLFSCALRAGGQVACWGAGATGRLGQPPPYVNRYEPVPVQDLEDAVAIAIGANHACAIRASGAVVCWGWNLHWQLGHDEGGSSPEPSPVSGLDDAIAIVAGRYHSCAVRSSGVAVCWGRNAEGQLGRGDLVDSHEPAAVAPASL